MTENTPRWVAGLSNGETLTENTGIVTPDGNASSWNKLQGHLLIDGLQITSFSLHVGDRHWNLPGGKRFQGETPMTYNCFRRHGVDMDGQNQEDYICAEAIFETYKVQQWVDIQDINKSWINILKI